VREVEREHLGLRSGAIAIAFLQQLRHAGMEFLAPAAQETAIGCFLHQRMLEHVRLRLAGIA
jgi:hypothetical protein